MVINSEIIIKNTSSVNWFVEATMLPAILNIRAETDRH